MYYKYSDYWKKKCSTFIYNVCTQKTFYELFGVLNDVDNSTRINFLPHKTLREKNVKSLKFLVYNAKEPKALIFKNINPVKFDGKGFSKRD